MATFVLVHGAFRGAHTFGRIRGPLRDAGHEVFTPSLTGIGERVHLCSPQVDLGTHIRDVVNVILYEDLMDIVLLGFSYGGFVITGVLQYASDRVSHLVYLDAFVPKDGESLNSLSNAAYGNPGAKVGCEWLVQPILRDYDDEERAAWENSRLTPHPVGCFREAVRVDRTVEEYPFDRTYVKATGDLGSGGGTTLWAAADRAKSSSAWHYKEIDTNHHLITSSPELCNLLLELA